MRLALAAVLFVHGFAHLPGFHVAWRFANLKELPYTTTLLADAVDVGEVGIRALGVLWLIAALAFMAASAGVLARTSWWLPVTGLATMSSLVLCVSAWPAARIGACVDAALVALLLAGRQIGRLP